MMCSMYEKARGFPDKSPVLRLIVLNMQTGSVSNLSTRVLPTSAVFAKKTEFP